MALYEPCGAYCSAHHNSKCSECGAFGSSPARIEHKNWCYLSPEYKKIEVVPVPKIETPLPEEEISESLAEKIAKKIAQLMGK